MAAPATRAAPAPTSLPPFYNSLLDNDASRALELLATPEGAAAAREALPHSGLSALHCAALSGCAELVARLLDAGAPLESTLDRPPMRPILVFGCGQAPHTPTSIDAVDALIRRLHPTLDVESTTAAGGGWVEPMLHPGATPLVTAVWMDRADVAAALLAAGAACPVPDMGEDARHATHEDFPEGESAPFRYLHKRSLTTAGHKAARPRRRQSTQCWPTCWQSAARATCRCRLARCRRCCAWRCSAPPTTRRWRRRWRCPPRRSMRESERRKLFHFAIS